MTTNQPYREIRPRQTSSPLQAGPSSDDSTKQAATRIACDACRKTKTKCGGQRPACLRCTRRGLVCVYQGEPDETPSVIAKRRAAASEQRLHRLEELFRQIATRPDRDAFAIYQRIRALRSSADIDAFIDFIQQGDMLAQMVQPLSSEFRPQFDDDDEITNSSSNDTNSNTDSTTPMPVTWTIMQQIVTLLCSLPAEDRVETITQLHVFLETLGRPQPIEPAI